MSNVLSLITAMTESGNKDYWGQGKPVTSPKGARYKMQVMPGTARAPGFGIRPAQNDTPEEWNRVGNEYLEKMRQRYGGNAGKMWAAYNWGPGNLDRALQRHGENWLAHAPKETRDYVAKNVGQLKKNWAGQGGQGMASNYGGFGGLPKSAPLPGRQQQQSLIPSNPIDLPMMPVPVNMQEKKPKKGPLGLSKDQWGAMLAAFADHMNRQNGTPSNILGGIMEGKERAAQQDYDRETRMQELIERRRELLAAQGKPHRMQNNNGDLVEIDPQTGQARILYVDPSPKPDWQKITDPTTGAVTLQPTPGMGMRPNEKHLQALAQNPEAAAHFDAKFGAGMAEYYLRQMGAR
jgi:soluble lytic murein transglycosylase